MPRSSATGSRMSNEHARQDRRKEIRDQQRNPGELSPGRFPELRIVRQTIWQTPLGDQWGDFLNGFAEEHYGKGHVRTLGSMALSFVTAQEMGRMLAKKYRRAFDTPRTALQVQRGFAKDFNQFVRDREQAAIDANNNKREEAEQALLNSDEIYISIADILSGDVDEMLPEPDSPRFNIGTFAVRGIQPYGKNGSDLGLDLSATDQFQKEFDDIVGYLKLQKLEVDLMDKDTRAGGFEFTPHAVILDGFYSLNSTSLRLPGTRPDQIELKAPAARVNH